MLSAFCQRLRRQMPPLTPSLFSSDYFLRRMIFRSPDALISICHSFATPPACPPPFLIDAAAAAAADTRCCRLRLMPPLFIDAFANTPCRFADIAAAAMMLPCCHAAATPDCRHAFPLRHYCFADIYDAYAISFISPPCFRRFRAAADVF